MHVCMYAYAYVYTHTCVCVFYMFTYIYIRRHAFVYLCIDVSMRVYIDILPSGNLIVFYGKSPFSTGKSSRNGRCT